eukprot:CAMPEP_0205826424 /NCGR_PEP_ID=MMETSP0206-20130828/28585_1 /ASSEMBLY_ACC=CAM_ASM_000279 /TAXON_ID=36767 /ORGANISM="Euplotes focardii, Strain TN1" /LENGTH=113 /DNA_ID=CAMNT_0053126331 /DNA_START=412 /DNA_END=753 /DNA_ORIENTATION=+
MREGRDLRNKVVYCGGHAYAIGGLNCKCEKLTVNQKKWSSIDDYVINDNLDSWSCAMMFTPSNSFSAQDMDLKDENEEGSENSTHYSQEFEIALGGSSTDEISEPSEDNLEYE